MNSTPANSHQSNGVAEIPVEMRLELIVLPVSDVDRSIRFYSGLGWSLDLDYAGADGYRVIQFTPPGSPSSIMFGTNMTTARPGTVQGLHLVVANIDTARDQLIRRGIAVSDVFHDGGGIFHRTGPEGHVAGPNQRRKSYASYASFSDPDGNAWVLQEVTARLSADLPTGETAFTPELSDAVRHWVAANQAA